MVEEYGQGASPQPPQQTNVPQVPQEPAAQMTTKPSDHEAARNSRKTRSMILHALIWIVVVLAVIVLAFVVAAYIAGFESVWEMLDWIRNNMNG